MTASVSAQCGKYHIKFTSDKYPITIELLRYENNFFIKPVKVIELDEEYVYSQDVDEYDSYVIRFNNSNALYLFIWDGDIEISINSNMIQNSITKKSPLTDEYYNFTNSVEKNIFNEIRKLDTLLHSLSKKSLEVSDPLYKDMKIKKSELISQGPKRYKNFVRDYFKNNQQSFISVYFFNRFGIIPDENERLILKNMSPQLRRNHRYIAIINR